MLGVFPVMAVSGALSAFRLYSWGGWGLPRSWRCSGVGLVSRHVPERTLDISVIIGPSLYSLLVSFFLP